MGLFGCFGWRRSTSYMGLVAGFGLVYGSSVGIGYGIALGSANFVKTNKGLITGIGACVHRKLQASGCTNVAQPKARTRPQPSTNIIDAKGSIELPGALFAS